jgi:hypothetical protein
MNRNNYSKLHTTYIGCHCPRCDMYKKLQSQDKCPKQKRESTTVIEPYGAFSIRAAVRAPYGGCDCNNWGYPCQCEECIREKVVEGVN